MSACADLQTRLTALEAGRDKLALGSNDVRIRAGEKERQFGPGDLQRVDQLIHEVRLEMSRRRCAGCRRRGRIVHVTPSDGC